MKPRWSLVMLALAQARAKMIREARERPCDGTPSFRLVYWRGATVTATNGSPSAGCYVTV